MAIDHCCIFYKTFGSDTRGIPFQPHLRIKFFVIAGQVWVGTLVKKKKSLRKCNSGTGQQLQTEDSHIHVQITYTFNILFHILWPSYAADIG